MGSELRLLMAALAALAMGCDSSAGVTASATEPIVGGVDAPPLPWMVGLFEPGDPSVPAAERHFCGGTLIDAEAGLVLTAAHCVSDEVPDCEDFEDCDLDAVESTSFAYRPEWIQVTVGSHRLSEIVEEDYLEVVEVIVHPEWSFETLEHDVAILRVVGVDPTTPTPRLAGDERYDRWLLHPSRPATVVGWGALSELGDETPDTLQWVRVPLVPRRLCSRLLRDSDVEITDAVLCAGRFRGGRDACAGDSGGPLVVRDFHGGPVLAGIVSWGEGCAQPLKPGVYTNVMAVRSWVVSCASGESTCDRRPEFPEDEGDW